MILITSPFLQVMCLHPLCSQNMLRWTIGVETTTQVKFNSHRASEISHFANES